MRADPQGVGLFQDFFHQQGKNIQVFTGTSIFEVQLKMFYGDKRPIESFLLYLSPLLEPLKKNNKYKWKIFLEDCAALGVHSLDDLAKNSSVDWVLRYGDFLKKGFFSFYL
jgi:hypothetical protein